MEEIDFLNAIILLANFVLIPAISYGSQLAIAALGITIVYAVLRFSNFAHGDLMAFGTMIAILITWLLQSWGITGGVLPTALIALPFAMACTALFCLILDRVVYKFYREQKSQPVVFMIVSVGVMFIMNAIVRFIIGPKDRTFFDGEKFIIRAVEFKEYTGLAEGLSIKSTQVITIFIAIITCLLYTSPSPRDS